MNSEVTNLQLAASENINSSGAIMQLAASENTGSYAITNTSITFEDNKCIIPRTGDSMIPLYVGVKQNDNINRLKFINLIIGGCLVAAYPINFLIELGCEFKIFRNTLFYKLPVEELKFKPIIMVALLYHEVKFELVFENNDNIIESKLYLEYIFYNTNERRFMVENQQNIDFFQINRNQFLYNDVNNICEYINYGGLTNGIFINCNNIESLKEIKIKINNYYRINYTGEEINIFTKFISRNMLYVAFNGIRSEYNDLMNINGSLNLNRLDSVQIELVSDENINFLNVYSLVFNKLRYSSGMAGVVYSFNNGINELGSNPTNNLITNNIIEDNIIRQNKIYDGDDVCAISLSTIGHEYMQCSNCNKPYNKSELITWFNTNNIRSCPSCRSNWGEMIIYLNVE